MCTRAPSPLLARMILLARSCTHTTWVNHASLFAVPSSVDHINLFSSSQAVWYPNIGSVLQYTGAVCGGFYVYALPLLVRRARRVSLPSSCCMGLARSTKGAGAHTRAPPWQGSSCFILPLGYQYCAVAVTRIRSVPALTALSHHIVADCPPPISRHLPSPPTTSHHLCPTRRL